GTTRTQAQDRRLCPTITGRWGLCRDRHKGWKLAPDTPGTSGGQSMSRTLLKTAFLAAAITPLFAGAAFAADPGIRAAALGDTSYPYTPVYNGVPYNGVYGNYNFATNYPAIQASLYPCPKPDVPLEVGRTIITNPALAPHEMLYCHKYRALYPP